MSTAAHEPRRVGPRRADSPSGSKVTPRRNPPETSDPSGLQYDSDELPVLIRLPNLRDLGSVETRPATPKHKKRHRVDSGSGSTRKQKTSKQNASNATDKPRQKHVGSNKLVLGGVAGGILVVVLLVLFNINSSTAPVDEDGWANEAAALQAPEIELPNEIAPPEPHSDLGFAYEAPQPESPRFDSSEPNQTPIGVPLITQPQAPRQSETAALPSKQQPVAGWPSDTAMGQQTPAGAAPVNLWPGEGLSVEQGGYAYPSADSPSQTDSRSSMYQSDTESYRMGKLDAGRPQAPQADSGSILNGNIEIPDTTSIR